MKISCFLVLLCALWEVKGYPHPYYGSNFDTISYGSADSSRGGMVLSRYYNPYYNKRAVGGGMAAFMFRPEEQYQPQTSQYYLPDRRRQTQPELNYSPQQNEVYYPQVPEQAEQIPEQPVIVQEQPVALPERPVAIPEQPAPQPELPVVTEASIADPIDKSELLTTTLKAIIEPELAEPETEEIPKPVSTPRKRVTKKKQVKKPVDEDEEEEEAGDDYPPRMPSGAYFPMFFGWGGRSAGAPSGATAIANAFSTGRGGVATSHATAYGPPKQEKKY